LPVGTLAASRFVIGANALDSNDRIIYNSNNGDLFFDSNGNGSGGKVQIAELSSGLGVTAADFDVV
jgi:Ca2+-binding RTX toxin-like protein